MNRLCDLLSRLRQDRRGSVAVMLAAGLVLFVGLGAFVVDIGYLFHVRRVMQTSADMAALAGAQDINSGSSGQAISTAISYSGVPGNRNAQSGLDITMASGYPALRCFSSTGMSCTGPDSANGIVVKQQTEVPLFFAKIFGNSTMQVAVTSVAGKGGTTKPADVMVILDTTASMNSVDPSCSIVGATQAGLRLRRVPHAALGIFSDAKSRRADGIPGSDVDRGGGRGIRLQQQHPGDACVDRRL